MQQDNLTNITLYARIQNRLKAIREFPICQLSLRQPALVDLLVDIVNNETDNGRATNGCWGVTSQNYWNPLREVLKDAGYKFLGAGHFSAAFKHEMLPGKVIKVGFKKEDSGAAYAAYCRLNAGKKGLPVIHELRRHTSCYTVVLDELTSVENRIFEQHPDFYNQYSLVQCVVEGGEGARSGINYPELYETCKGIREFFYGVASFDIHDGNVMMDKDGHIVITDPVSYTADEEMNAADLDNILEELAVIREKHRIVAIQNKARCRHERKHMTAERWRRHKFNAKRKRKLNRERKLCNAHVKVFRKNREVKQLDKLARFAAAYGAGMGQLRALDPHGLAGLIAHRDKLQAASIPITHRVKFERINHDEIQWKHCKGLVEQHNADFAELERIVAANIRAHEERRAQAMLKILTPVMIHRV